MSKSLGNVIAPQDITKRFGAEILRLWVSAEDYREDVRISDEILNRLVEAYRRLRNTARFLISNLYDFDPARDLVTNENLDELDRWILHRTQNVLDRCREAYDKYEFHVVYHTLNNFCSVDLSALYLDIVKDRLYCEGATSTKRKAAQTALYKILEVLVHLLGPILSFTAEEIWGYMPDKERRPGSVFLSAIPEPEREIEDQKLAERWDRVFKARSEILKALEVARAGGIIGHSLDAEIMLYKSDGQEQPELKQLMDRDAQHVEDIIIVSQLTGTNGPKPSFLWELEEARKAGIDGASAQIRDDNRTGWGYYSKTLESVIAVFKARGDKCERCWKYEIDIGKDSAHPTVCPRCASVLKSGATA
jgi:isoleucyl-tRNA synthetase